MLTLAEAAEHLRVSERTVREEIYRKRLRAVKVGPARNAPVRISEEALAEYKALYTVGKAAS